jgi:hypothetical protein
MKLESFRKIIREEVRSVIKEELSLIMQTPITETKITKKPVIEQQIKKPSFSEIVNEEIVQSRQPKKIITPTGNPILDILNETAADDEWRNLNGGYNSSHAAGFAGGMPGGTTRVVDSVDQMLAGKQGATDITQVSIDAVPDFSGVMNKLKENGKI